MIFCPVLAHNSDAVNHFCAIAAPLLFVYIGAIHLLGPGIERYLIKNDTYSREEIKIRSYSIVRTTIPVLILAFGTLYFALHEAVAVASIMMCTLLGYGWIRINGTYCVRVKYTDKDLIYRTWKNETTIPMEAVSKMAWEAGRHSLGYMLVIYCANGQKIYLSSADFIGLNKLKATFDRL